MREANELMEVSRRQVELMRRQADEALEQAERMNDLLGRLVRLTEPLEKAQRGGEVAAGVLKRAIFGEEGAAEVQRVEGEVERAERLTEGAAERAEEAAERAKRAAAEAAEEAAIDRSEGAEPS